MAWWGPWVLMPLAGSNSSCVRRPQAEQVNQIGHVALGLYPTRPNPWKLNSGADQQGNLMEYLRFHTRFHRAYVTLCGPAEPQKIKFSSLPTMKHVEIGRIS